MNNLASAGCGVLSISVKTCRIFRSSNSWTDNSSFLQSRMLFLTIVSFPCFMPNSRKERSRCGHNCVDISSFYVVLLCSLGSTTACMKGLKQTKVRGRLTVVSFNAYIFKHHCHPAKGLYFLLQAPPKSRLQTTTGKTRKQRA